MYALEAPLFIPLDEKTTQKSYRVADLVIFFEGKCCFVEIDGLSHRDETQKSLDNTRDHLTWINSSCQTIRVGNQFAQQHPLRVIGLIAIALMPNIADDLIKDLEAHHCKDEFSYRELQIRQVNMICDELNNSKAKNWSDSAEQKKTIDVLTNFFCDLNKKELDSFALNEGAFQCQQWRLATLEDPQR